MSKKPLDEAILLEEARLFSILESQKWDEFLFNINDGKTIGTYLEHRFQDMLKLKYDFIKGSSALWIDFPGINVDIKVTSIKQPQSSCPFKSARQKIYGLGYSLLLFVYEKEDNPKKQRSRLNILHNVYIKAERTADYQISKNIIEILTQLNDDNEEAIKEDIKALILDRNLPIDDIQLESLVDEIKNNPPAQGYLTISNALQWKLQYARIVQNAGNIDGLVKII